jgi:hypothetical protein
MVRFPLGRIVVAPAVLDLLEKEGLRAQEFIARHASGDWGELGESDRKKNDEAVLHFGRLLSSYSLNGHRAVWVVTEADRSGTALLLVRLEDR